MQGVHIWRNLSGFIAIFLHAHVQVILMLGTPDKQAEGILIS